MNTVLKLEIKSDSSSLTEQLGAKIGSNLRGGEIIRLSSDLGGGKTTFVKGLASGAGSNDLVTSPTFTISKIYQCPKFLIHHFDFYRLSDVGIMTHDIQESIADPHDVVVIEWADIITDILPVSRVDIEIDTISPTDRAINLRYPIKYKYLLEDL